MNSILNDIELRFIQTCGAFPEQWEVFVEDTGTQVGYIRLRHGLFIVQCPDVGKTTVFTEELSCGDGMFLRQEDREKYLDFAEQAIRGWLNTQKSEDIY